MVLPIIQHRCQPHFRDKKKLSLWRGDAYKQSCSVYDFAGEHKTAKLDRQRCRVHETELCS